MHLLPRLYLPPLLPDERLSQKKQCLSLLISLRLILHEGWGHREVAGEETTISAIAYDRIDTAAMQHIWQLKPTMAHTSTSHIV